MINGDVYFEVFEILKHMDKMTVMKIPENILKEIKENRNVNYSLNIDKNDILNRNKVLPETIKYIAWLDVNYWESKEEKKRLKSIQIAKFNSN